MNFDHMTNLWIYPWVIIPFLIFFARVCDVSLGTIRIIFISRGIKYLPPLVGFFEILIWLLAIGQIMQNLTNIYYYLFYAGGFATGNLVGIILDEKLSIGTVGIRIITKKDAAVLVEALRTSGFGVTCVDAKGASGCVNVIYTIIERIELQKVISMLEEHNPNAFYSIEDIKEAHEGIFPTKRTFLKRKSVVEIDSTRKAK